MLLLIILLLMSCFKLNDLKLDHKEKISKENLLKLYTEKDYYYFQQYINYLEYVKSNCSILTDLFKFNESGLEELKQPDYLKYRKSNYFLSKEIEERKKVEEFLFYVKLSDINIATIRNKIEEVQELLEKSGPEDFERDHYGNTPLHYAAYFGYYDIFKFLLKNMPKSLIDSTYSRYSIKMKPKPIHLLAMNTDRIKDREEILALILKENSQALNEEDPVGHTPLMYASISNNIEMFKVMFNTNPSSLDQETVRKINVLDYLGMYGCVDIYKFLIENNVSPDTLDSNERTAFMLACANNKEDFVKYCSSQEVSITKMDNQKKSGIVYATIYGHLNIVKSIIDFAKEKNIKDSKEFQNNLLISLLACIELFEDESSPGSLSEIINLIMENINDINIKDENLTPLLHALNEQKYELIKLFLERKEINLFEKSDEYDSIIEAAIAKADLNALKLFINKLNKEQIYSNIEKWKKILDKKLDKNEPEYDEIYSILTSRVLVEKEANANNKDDSSTKALMIASRDGNIEIAKLLIDKADVNYKDNYGWTPLIWSSIEGRTEVVKLLIKNGANVNYKDNNGKTALMYASEKGHTEVAKLLIEKGANVNFKDTMGRTASMYASYNGRTEVVKILIENRTDVNWKDNYDKTVLMYTSEKGHIEVAKLLIEKGADVNYKNNKGNTALMYASYNGCTEVVKLLIEGDADINYKDNNGKTALMYASEKGHTEVAKLLIKNGAN